MESTQTAGLDTLVRRGAAVLGLIYACGFIITTWHHASYGITTFDLLRPRLLSAGAAFLLLTAVPILAAFRVFGVAGFTKHTSGEGLSSTNANRVWLKLFLAAAFYLLSYQFASFFMIFFEHDRLREAYPWQAMIFVVGFAFGGGWLRKHFDDYAPQIAALAWVSIVWFFIASFRLADHMVVLLSIWFYVVGLGSVILFSAFSTDPMKAFKTTDWEYHLALLALTLIFYSTTLHSQLRPQFGGGSPVPARVFLTESIAPFQGAREIQAFIIDETPDGFFVLTNKKEHRGLFVSRRYVAAVDHRERMVEVTANAPKR